VYATTTTTELFFRQAVGRFVRWTRGVPRQRAWLFIPDDARVRVVAWAIAEQRRHSLRRRDEELARPLMLETGGDPDQVSLFAVISAVATGSDDAGDEHYEDIDDGDEFGFELTLGEPPPLAGGPADAASTRREEKSRLRNANTAVAREISRRTGLTHARVNAELNRLSGIRRIAQATAPELSVRLRAANRWLAKT
jgi:hypothetical protein